MSFGRRRHTRRSFKSKWSGEEGQEEGSRARRGGEGERGGVGVGDGGSRVASLGTEKSGSGQTVLRVVRRIVSDPDSPGVKPNRLLKRDDDGLSLPVFSLRHSPARWLK